MPLLRPIDNSHRTYGTYRFDTAAALVKWYFDLNRREFITSPGSGSPISTVSLKRGDNLEIIVVFVRDLTVVDLGVGAIGRLGLKPTDNFDGAYLAAALSWVKTGSSTTAQYAFDLNLNTEALDDLLGVGAPADIPSAVVNLEMEFQVGGRITSSNTVLATVLNDVNRGSEGTPLEQPFPEDWLSARAVRWQTGSAVPVDEVVANETLFPDDIFADGGYVEISGVTYTFKDTPVGIYDIDRSGTANDQLSKLWDFIVGNESAPEHPTVNAEEITAGPDISLLLTARTPGIPGNSNYYSYRLLGTGSPLGPFAFVDGAGTAGTPGSIYIRNNAGTRTSYINLALPGEPSQWEPLTT